MGGEMSIGIAMQNAGREKRIFVISSRPNIEKT
jgi:hypothetical protein